MQLAACKKNTPEQYLPPALPQACLVNCATLLSFSHPLPEPALCFKGLFQYILRPASVHHTVLTACIAPVMHSSTAAFLSWPLPVSYKNYDHYLKEKHPSCHIVSPTLHDPELSLCLPCAQFLSPCCRSRAAHNGSSAL